MTNNYDMREAIDLVLADFQGALHTAFPAKVVAYDAAAQTVDVVPALKREVTADDGGFAYDAMPTLYGVQIMWPRAGGFALVFPISVGDWCKVTCAEQSTLAWRRSGVAPSPPGISDPHGLNGLVAEVGWCPDREKLSNVNTTQVELRSVDGSIRIAVSPTMVTLGSEVGAKAVALAPLVEAAIAAAINGHSHAVSTTGTATAQTGATTTVVPAHIPSTAATKVRGV